MWMGAENDYNVLREDARPLFKRIQEASAEVDPDRKLSSILGYIPGKTTDSIDGLIVLYRPDLLVVGTRGRKGPLVTFAGIASISKYCLQHSPVLFMIYRRSSGTQVEKHVLAGLRVGGSSHLSDVLGLASQRSWFTSSSRLVLASMTPRLPVHYSQIVFKGLDLNSKLLVDSRANMRPIGGVRPGSSLSTVTKSGVI
ncbi:hypothetical protein BKA70DRAFT_1568212 [Coprinopsis sp. MPI-PUGE-AT-0042]|nr:hypothetical protein BKA70DRAFT_1568212 [Coprinopsis sp. MPI-PUGE-AT-0042]